MESKKSKKVQQQRPNYNTCAPNCSKTPSSILNPSDAPSLTVDEPAIGDRKNHPAAPKTSILELALQAIQVLGRMKKGASFVAIKKWIIDTKGGVKNGILVGTIKKAILKGIESGLIRRTAATETCRGATGSFLLAKKSSKMRKTSGKKNFSVNKLSQKAKEKIAAGLSQAKKLVTKSSSDGAGSVKKISKRSLVLLKNKLLAKTNSTPPAKTNSTPPAKMYASNAFRGTSRKKRICSKLPRKF